MNEHQILDTMELLARKAGELAESMKAQANAADHLASTMRELGTMLVNIHNGPYEHIKMPTNWRLKGTAGGDVYVEKILGTWEGASSPVVASMYSLSKSVDSGKYVVGPGLIPELTCFYVSNNTQFYDEYLDAWNDLKQRVEKHLEEE